MAQEPQSLCTFQCDGREIDIDGYIIWVTDFGYPQQQDHPTRVGYEQAFTRQAQNVFGRFPVVMLWPTEDQMVNHSNGMCSYSGVRVTADCSGIWTSPDGNTRREKLIVIWFQSDYSVFPDPVIVPVLQGLDWAHLAAEMDEDD
jgi:hypothetical protein